MTGEQRLLIDRKTLELVRSYVPQEDALAAMSEFFSALGDGTRLKLISALSICEMCVTDLSLKAANFSILCCKPSILFREQVRMRVYFAAFLRKVIVYQR